MDVPATLVMSPGQTLTFDLPGLGGAGYLWAVEVLNAGVVLAAIVRRGQEPPESDEHRQVGRGLPETLRLTAQTPGTAAVRVSQRRPWEDGPPRDERHTEVVVVAADSTLDELPWQEDTQHEGGRQVHPTSATRTGRQPWR